MRDVRIRLIAIAGDEDSVAALKEVALRHAGFTFGLMLRDPEHRPERTRSLAAYAAACGLPPNVRVIANGAPVPTASFLHLTTSQLVDRSEEALHALAAQGPFGASAHSLEEAERAARSGASYIALSPIFPTPSKPGHPGIGLDALREIASSLSLPVYALGGMNDLNRIIAALDAGAHGIASISLFAPPSHAMLELVIEQLRER